MQSIYTPSQKKFISYSKQELAGKKSPWVIYVHGLMSNMSSTKATCIQEFCQKRNYNYIKFDNFGSGDSSGVFAEETITSWLEGLTLIVEEVATGPVVLVGSSAGAWLAILAAMKNPNKILSVITVAAAIDFTDELIWQKLTQSEKDQMQQSGICGISNSKEDEANIFPISYNLILDGKEHLLLNDDKPINLMAPVHIIHGMQDSEVPFETSLRLANQISHNDVTIKLSKDGYHRMSDPKSLNLIYSSIDDVLLHLHDIKIND